MKKDSYAENYAMLKAIADRFRAGGPADIDTLVESFRTAQGAYDACRDRLDAIRTELDQEKDRTRREDSTDADPFA
jgi:hypothetical protein